MSLDILFGKAIYFRLFGFVLFWVRIGIIRTYLHVNLEIISVNVKPGAFKACVDNCLYRTVKPVVNQG